MTTLKITELPTFVQEIVQDKLYEVYKHNTELASAIFDLADTRIIGKYIPELKGLYNLTSRLVNFNKEFENFMRGSYSMKIDGFRLPIDVEVAQAYLSVLELDIIKCISKLGGQK